MKTTTKGDKIAASDPAREQEIVNIINTFDELSKSTDAALKAEPYDQEAFEAAYRAQWQYYSDHADIINKVNPYFD